MESAFYLFTFHSLQSLVHFFPQHDFLSAVFQLRLPSSPKTNTAFGSRALHGEELSWSALDNILIRIQNKLYVSSMFSFDEEKIVMLKSGFQPSTITYKNWNPNVKPFFVKGPLPVLACEIGYVCVQTLPVAALRTVGARLNFKITPATEPISAYFNILLFPSQIKFSIIRTQITSKLYEILPNQNCIFPPCS